VGGFRYPWRVERPGSDGEEERVPRRIAHDQPALVRLRLLARVRDPLADTVSGQPRIDPTLDVPEPSLSRFDPVNAKAATLKRRRRARTRRG